MGMPEKNIQRMSTLTLVFATNNEHKVAEIRNVTGGRLHLLTLKEAGIDIDIPEPYDTLEANAREKSAVIHQMTQQNCFSDDSGLEVTALNGEPGVKSARYAGDGRNFQQNISKLLYKLDGSADRSAQFRTVVCLIWNNEEHIFEGICKGHIITEQRGSQGFGYDPIFVPEGSDKTFAEMTTTEKNEFSHRRKAMTQLITFLEQVI
jgi:XTP/dITP diphosphohydrolase